MLLDEELARIHTMELKGAHGADDQREHLRLRIHTMELKGDNCWVNGTGWTTSGIHTMELKVVFKTRPSPRGARRIHTMELKVWVFSTRLLFELVKNPYNGIERCWAPSWSL